LVIKEEKEMKLSKEKINAVLLNYGLSTRRSERIAEDLASRDLTEDEKKKKGIRFTDVNEVVKDLTSKDLTEDEKKKKGIRFTDVNEVVKED